MAVGLRRSLWIKCLSLLALISRMLVRVYRVLCWVAVRRLPGSMLNMPHLNRAFGGMQCGWPRQGVLAGDPFIVRVWVQGFGNVIRAMHMARAGWDKQQSSVFATAPDAQFAVAPPSGAKDKRARTHAIRQQKR